MQLSLTVVGSAASALGSRARVRWVDRGGTIGRALDNDWVIPDHNQEISRHHAAVHFLDGGFYLEDTSANGIGINSAAASMAADSLQRLRDGQHLYVGPYRIWVQVDAGEAVGPDRDHTHLPRGKNAVKGPTADLAAASRAATPRDEGASAGVGEDALQRLLRGAGLQGDFVTRERAEELGRILRTVVQGVVDLLQKRAQFRNELRLPTTTLASQANNPLKLSTDARDALHNLLLKDNPGYLRATEAFESAFTDLEVHQEAMMEGLREAYNAMLKRFDPMILEAAFKKRHESRWSGLLSGPGSTRRRAWALYKDYFAGLGGQDDGGFESLFRDSFARAYEARLAHGRSARGRRHRDDDGKSHGRR